jgi:GNAT superfamily N-acetyltransferase
LSLTEWDRDRAGDLAGLVEVAFPGDPLTPDELVACCWDDPGVVLGDAAGDTAVAVVMRDNDGNPTGWVKLLAVAPSSQGIGRGRDLLAAAEAWAWDHGARRVRAGSSAPFYLWPGVDVRWTRALSLLEGAGWVPTGAELNLSCPTTHRARPPEGVELRRVLEPADAEAVVGFVDQRWPHWVAETRRGIEHGSCFAALAGGDVVGFACHSVNRGGWVGPMGTDPGRQRGGVGSALLGSLCQDLRVAGYPDAEIAWVATVRFYAKAAGASVSRVFRQLVKPRP